MPYNDILYDKRDAVATITINRPHAMNAATIKTYDEMIDALRDAEADDSVRVVVLTGAGRAFCAGDDIKEIFLNPEFRHAKPAQHKLVEEWREHRPVALDLLVTYPKPTIASVNGAAVGYGCDIALMCDMRVCSDQARFGEVFIRRGLIPESRRTANTAASRRTRARLRINFERRHYRRRRSRANRDGEQSRAARAARRSDRRIREKNRSAGPTRAAPREGSFARRLELEPAARTLVKLAFFPLVLQPEQVIRVVVGQSSLTINAVQRWWNSQAV